MIHVKYGPGYLSVEGHANAAPKGEDLVCAAASMLVGTLQSAIERLIRNEAVTYACCDTRDGHARFISERSDAALAAFQVIEDGFQLLAEDHPECVKMEFAAWRGPKLPEWEHFDRKAVYKKCVCAKGSEIDGRTEQAE